MVAGRPREHDRDQIAIDLIEWAKLPDSINLNGFCCSREPPLSPSKIGDWARECDKFRGAYLAAKAFLGNRREKLLSENKLHTKAYDLNASVYDLFLKEERIEQSQREISMKKEESHAFDKSSLEQLAALMNQFQSNTQLSASNNPESNISNET